MTLTARIAWDDTVLPFQLDRSGIRGRVLRLDSVLESILSRHAYPAPVDSLVAEAAILTALIGTMVKLRWRLSLQVRGDGPVRLIATDYFAPSDPAHAGGMRAYAGFDPARIDQGASAAQAIGQGHFAITIDQGQGALPYQGITPITGGSLAASAEGYFAQSEQLPTRFALTAARAAGPSGRESWRGGGVMLQKMPQRSAPTGGEATGAGGLPGPDDLLRGEEAEDWGRANRLLDTVEAAEMIGPGVTPPDLLVRLFHEETPRVFEARAIEATCTCSRGKVLSSIAAHDPAEIEQMVTETGEITADCQFCGAHYRIDPAEARAARGGDDG